MTIVFFDGYCGLCSGVVDFLIARDKNRTLRYSPLQGETARARLSESERTDLDTVVVITADGRKLYKSDAILETLAALGSKSSEHGNFEAIALGIFAKFARFIPRRIRDLIYDLIAKNRFRLMGRRDTCRLPTREEQSLFLP